MARQPQEIKRIDDSGRYGVEISWSDGTRNLLDAELLRKNCPCAVCKEMRGDTSHAKPLSAKKSLLKVIESSKDEELRLERIWQVGQYAIGMQWGDGHNTGIYTFNYLEQLADNPPED